MKPLPPPRAHTYQLALTEPNGTCVVCHFITDSRRRIARFEASIGFRSLLPFEESAFRLAAQAFLDKLPTKESSPEKESSP